MALTPRPIEYTLAPPSPHHIYYPSLTNIAESVGHVLGITIHVGPKCVVAFLSAKVSQKLREFQAWYIGLAPQAAHSRDDGLLPS